MQKMRKSSAWLIAFLFIFILAFDQTSKIFIVKYLQSGDTINIAQFFNIVRVENKGITFGLFSNIFHQFVWIFISVIVIIYLCRYGIENKQYQIPICIIVSGAVGNIMDRIIYKSVIDFLDFHCLAYHWPAFNIADSAIVVGAFIFFLISYTGEKI